MGEQEERQARFEHLYDQASLQVLGYALRRADTPEDAADIVSETFMIAWRRLDEVPVGDEARLWLYGVARRVLANQRRGQQRRERLNARLRDEVAVVSAWAEAGRPAPDSAVMAALAHLDEADRELITLVAWNWTAIRSPRCLVAAVPRSGCGCTAPGAASPGCSGRKGTRARGPARPPLPSPHPSRFPPSTTGPSASAPWLAPGKREGRRYEPSNQH